MQDEEVIIWLTRLKNSIKGKFEPELELTVALTIAIDRMQTNIEKNE